MPDGDDTVAMRACLAGLGVAIEGGEGTVVVAGTGGRLRPRPYTILHAGLAGTTSRFVTALAALAPVGVVVDGHAPLRTRPMAELHEALSELGAGVEPGERTGHLPVRVTGPLTSGGTVRMAGDVSSQFITALMLIAPSLSGGVRIELTTPLVSGPYIRLTAAVMSAFGVGGVEISERHVAVPTGAYVGRRYEIEPDASSASYPLALAAVCGGRVTVPGLGADSLQGDWAIVDLLGRMGCDVDLETDQATVSRPADQPLGGLDVDMADVSDLVPTVATVATLATTPSVIRGVGFIRAKESDRLGDLAAELRKVGADIEVTEDGLRIEPVPRERLYGATLDTHHDHRLAMAFAVAGAVVDGVEVADPDVVSKSWPGFWAAYERALRPPVLGSPAHRNGG
ncbi:3-phosphoshikimate 1-carboxyvinyltransferase [soil metagenome]